MTNFIDALGFSLDSLDDFTDEQLARGVIGALLSAQGDLRPVKYGSFEPLRDRIGDIQSLLDVWFSARSSQDLRLELGGLLLAGRGLMGYQIGWQKSADPKFSFVNGYVGFSILKKRADTLENLLQLVRSLVDKISPVYGEVRSMATRGWDNPLDLKIRLPDPPWISIYGPPYVKLFGEDKIRTAPFLVVEELRPGFWWLQASSSPFEEIPEDLKVKIRQHFGEDAFMNSRQRRYATGIAPDFDFSRVGLK
jgi:hypothetical protein